MQYFQRVAHVPYDARPRSRTFCKSVLKTGLRNRLAIMNHHAVRGIGIVLVYFHVVDELAPIGSLDAVAWEPYIAAFEKCVILLTRVRVPLNRISVELIDGASLDYAS